MRSAVGSSFHLLGEFKMEWCYYLIPRWMLQIPVYKVLREPACKY